MKKIAIVFLLGRMFDIVCMDVTREDIQALLAEGELLLKKGKHIQAIEPWQKAIDLTEKKFPDLHINLLYTLGLSYCYGSDGFATQPFVDEKENQRLDSDVLKAWDYFKKAEAVFPFCQDTKIISRIYHRLGLIKINFCDKIKNSDDSEVYYNKALEALKDKKKSFYSRILFDLSEYYHLKNNITLYREYLEKIQKIDQSVNPRVWAQAMLNYAQIQEDRKVAKKILQSVHDMGKFSTDEHVHELARKAGEFISCMR